MRSYKAIASAFDSCVSQYTRGLPAMIPIAMLYGTPEDAAAQIAYLKARGYAISWVDMGEEPEQVLLRDVPILAAVSLWAVTCAVVLAVD